MSTSSLIAQLEAVREEHGALTPALLVDVARDPDHPLHPRFEWDDSVAAEKWRLEQAGQLLRVTFRPDPQKASDLRAFVAVKGESTPTSEYVPVVEALADPITRELLLKQMKRDAQTFQRRWRHMASFADVVRSMLPEEASA